DEAAPAFKRVTELDPKNVAAHHTLGVCYLNLKKYTEAIECARTAIKLDPKFALAHACLGLALLKTGDISGARAALREAVRLDKKLELLPKELPRLEVAPPPHEKSK